MVTFNGPAQDGVYDIWVGTYGNETADATLYISELSAATDNGPVISGPITTGPNPTLAPAFGEANLQAGFPAATHDIPAGGTIDASTLGDGCYGYIAEAPDYAVNFQNIAGLLPLVFGVTSEGDTTLVVMDPAGNWLCNDDTNGLNPEVRVQSPPPGRYLIWLGNFAADGTTVPAILSISTPTGLGGAKP